MKTKVLASLLGLVLGLATIVRADEHQQRKWEYAFYTVNINADKTCTWEAPDGRLSFNDYQELMALLGVEKVSSTGPAVFEAIGQKGWELVAVDASIRGATQYIFKRPGS